MKATLKYLIIETKDIKPGYIVMHNNQFMTVRDIDDTHVALINLDETINSVATITDIQKYVVKFLAIISNVTYSIIHGNFKDIANYFVANPKLLEIFINHKGSIEIDGRLKHILIYPKVDNIVKLVDGKIFKKFNVSDDELDAVGVVKECNKNKFKVEFRTFTTDLKRAQFRITKHNSKEVFELC